MMTLDQAIKHCYEEVERLSTSAHDEADTCDIERERCEECANEHRQLAEWLTELKEVRETIAIWEARKISDFYVLKLLDQTVKYSEEVHE
jgi:hypothetical protein